MNTEHSDDLLRNGIEIRAWSTPRIYAARKMKPTQTMKRMIAETIVRECSEVIEICERMERLRNTGQTQTMEYRWLRLDLAKAQAAIDNAQAFEQRAFPEGAETR